MKPTHYHITWGFSAVTLYIEKGTTWTSDGYKASSVDLKPLSELVGVRVTRAGWTGTIQQFLSDERTLIDGKYSPSSRRYQLKRKLEFMNAQVGIFWDNNKDLKNCPLPPYWNNFNILKLL